MGSSQSSPTRKSSRGGRLSQASSSNTSMHQRQQNEKNRQNPTEKVDKWREKMLLDIGADPLSVIRDFPRMRVVFLRSDGEKDAANAPSAATREGRAAAAPHGGSTVSSSSSSSSRSTSSSRGESAPDGEGGVKASKRACVQESRQKNPLTGPPRHHRDAAAAAHGSSHTHKAHHSRGAGHRTHRKGSLADHEAVDAGEVQERKLLARRRRRLHRTVLALAELCDEGNTFGAAFTAAWDAKIKQYYDTHGSDAGGTSSSPGSPCGVGSLDIHQLFHAACVESGMLACTADSSAVESSVTKRAVGSRLNSRVPSLSFDPRTLATASRTTSLSRQESHADGAAARSATTVGASAKTEFLVRSATFHAMQFMVQGVVFFPSQRLKHVLWFPWAPAALFSDIDWTVYVYAEENIRDLSSYVFRQKLSHSTVRPRPGPAVDAESANSKAADDHNNDDDEGDDDAAARRAPGAAMRSSDAPRGGRHELIDADLAADTEATPLLFNAGGADDDDAAAAALRARHDPYGSYDSASCPPLRTSDGDPQSHMPSTVESGAGKKLLVVKHVQTIQHFVADGDRKKIPKYQVDWSCSVFIDKKKLESTYAAYRRGSPGASPTTAERHAPFCCESNANSSGKEGAGERSGGGVDGAAMATQHAGVGSAAAAANTFQPPLAPPTSPPLANISVTPASSAIIPLRCGVRASEQQALVADEVVFASIGITGARVEAVKKGLCGFPSQWARNKTELQYMLDDQYSVSLEELPQLPGKKL